MTARARTAPMTLAERLRTRLPAGFTQVPDHEPTFWLRARIADVLTRRGLFELNQCGHLNLGVVGVVALWDDARAVCTECVPTLSVHGAADHTCDRCAAVTPITHQHLTVPAADLLVIFGLCPTCHRRESAE